MHLRLPGKRVGCLDLSGPAEGQREEGTLACSSGSAAFELPESFLCGHRVTPLEKDLTAGVPLTMVCVGRGCIVGCGVGEPI